MKNLQIKNKANNKAELYIYGDIISGDWKWEDSDVTSTEVRDFLKEIEDVENLDIYINSGGGSVFTGMAIYNMLKRFKGTKTVHVDGVAASIASVIAMAGDKIIIPSNSYLMVHKAWTITAGNADEMIEMAETLEKMDQGILNVYENKIKDGVDIETIKDLVKNSTWLTGDEAVNYFNVEVTEEVNIAACASEHYKNYLNMPKELLNKPQPQQQPPKREEPQDNSDIEMLELELELIK